MADKKNSVDALIEFVLKEFEFCHTSAPQSYATVNSDSGKFDLKVMSGAFKDHVRLMIYKTLGVPVRTAVLKEIVEFADSYAKINGSCRPVHLRSANTSAGVYIDLGLKTGQIVKITAEGYKVIRSRNVSFFRPPGQKPLVLPKEGGGFKRFNKLFKNLTLNDFKLVLCWMAFAVHGKGPFPILVIQGEQGSAKTFFMKVVRDLLDPIVAPIISMPRGETDLAIVAQNNFILACDNVSRVSDEMADNLCRMATGAGLSNRALYTDDEQKIFDSCRPVILNGITDFILKSDLADRVLLINPGTISEKDRRPENEVWAEYQEAKPRILGSLYGAVSIGLKNLDSVELTSLPRMADFAKFSCAIAPAVKWSQEELMKTYDDNRKALANVVFSSDKVVEAILDFIREEGEWEGTATQLLQDLELRSENEELIKKKYWPGSAAALGSKIMQYAPVLRQKGVGHEVIRKNSSRKHKFWLLK